MDKFESQCRSIDLKQKIPLETLNKYMKNCIAHVFNYCPNFMKFYKRCIWRVRISIIFKRVIAIGILIIWGKMPYEHFNVHNSCWTFMKFIFISSMSLASSKISADKLFLKFDALWKYWFIWYRKLLFKCSNVDIFCWIFMKLKSSSISLTLSKISADKMFKLWKYYL